MYNRLAVTTEGRRIMFSSIPSYALREARGSRSLRIAAIKRGLRRPNNGYHPQRFFVRCVSDQIIADDAEPQGPGSEIGSPMTMMRKGNQQADSAEDAFPDTARCLGPVFCNEFPNSANICGGFGVKSKSLIGDVHCRDLSSSSSRNRKASKKASPSMGFTRLFRAAKQANSMVEWRQSPSFFRTRDLK